MNKYSSFRSITGAILFSGLFVCLLTACTLRSTTSYVKAPLPQKEFTGTYKSSCLDIEKIKKELNCSEKDELSVLRYHYRDPVKQKELLDEIEKVIIARKISCNPPNNRWQVLRKQIQDHHEGMLDENVEKKAALGQLKSDLKYDNLALDSEKKMSVSFQTPASLSLSTRPLPSEQEPGGAFAGLKERAQASLIDYAKTFTIKDDKKKAPSDAAKELLDTLSKPAEPRFTDTHKVEFTVSAILNSAVIDDRFDYIAAYLDVPLLPGPIYGGTSLVRLFLGNFQAMTFAQNRDERDEFIVTDIHRALEAIQVRIEVVDPLKTEPSKIELGKLTSDRSLGISGGSAPGTSFNLTGISASASQKREENIEKELDKRAYWINPDRSLLRITQRGMQEATISGSFSSAITLKIPKTSYYVLELTEKDDRTSKSVSLSNIEAPLYARVDAIGAVLGTVRVAILPMPTLK